MVKALTTPPPDEIRLYVAYDPVTGAFTRMKRDGGYAVGSRVGGVDPQHGYYRVVFRGRHYQGHRLAWWFVHGEYPPEVDHRDHDKANNRLKNLRPCLHSHNLAHRNFPVGKSGFRGVRKHGKKWQAMIGHKGGDRYIGTFATAEEAARAYDQAALTSFGSFANLNFPRDLAA